MSQPEEGSHRHITSPEVTSMRLVPRSDVTFHNEFGPHIERHFNRTPGSQFDSNRFPTAQSVEDFIREYLPKNIPVPSNLDAPISLTHTFTDKDDREIGTVGVISLAEAEICYAGRPITRGMRNRGGEPTTLETSEGIMQEVYAYTDKRGTRIEPAVNLLRVGEGENHPPTSQLSCIIRANPNGTLEIITAYPGPVSPPIPVRIHDPEGNIIKDTLEDKDLIDFWSQMVFLH